MNLKTNKSMQTEHVKNTWKVDVLLCVGYQKIRRKNSTPCHITSFLPISIDINA